MPEDVYDGHSLSSGNNIQSVVPGKVGDALYFDQTADNFLTSASSHFDTGAIEFTFSVWFRTESDTTVQYIISKHHYESSFAQYSLHYNPSGTINFRIHYNGIATVYSTLTSSVPIVVGEWYFVVFWYDPATVESYIQVNNGAVESQSASPPMVNAGVSFFVGVRTIESGSSTYGNFEGVIDELGFWNRLLTADERTALYNNGNGLAYPFMDSAPPYLFIPVADTVSVIEGVRIHNRPTRDIEVFDTVAVETSKEATVLAPAPALQNKLIAYWQMDEASGNALDVWGTNHLTPTGGVGSAEGRVNTARNFPSSAYVSRVCGTALSPGDINFTFSCWVKGSTTANNATVLARRDATYTDISLHILNNRFEFWVEGPPCFAGGFVHPGVWYFVVCWYDAANKQIGISVNNGPPGVLEYLYGVSAKPTALFILGYSGVPVLGATGGYWDGEIDEVGFWQRLLTAEERTILYNNGAGITFPFGIVVPTVLDINRGDTLWITDRGKAHNQPVIDIEMEETVSIVDAPLFFPNTTSPFMLYLSGGPANEDPDLSLGGTISSFIAGSQQFTDPGIPGVTIVHASGNEEGDGSLEFYPENPLFYGENNPYLPRLDWGPPGSESSGSGPVLNYDGRYHLGTLTVEVVLADLPKLSMIVPVTITNTPNQIFDSVLSPSEVVNGQVDYRCLYMVNVAGTGTEQIFDDIAVELYTSPLFATIEVGLDPAGEGDGKTSGKAVRIGDELVIPDGVAFLPLPPNDSLSLGSLMPGKVKALWLRRTILPESGFVDHDAAKLIFSITPYGGFLLAFEYEVKYRPFRAWDFEYPFQIIAPFVLGAPLFTQKARIGTDIVYGFGSRVAAGIDIDARLAQRAVKAWDFPYLFTTPARREFVLVGGVRSRAIKAFVFADSIKSTQRSQRGWELVCGLFSVSAITVVTSPIITINGVSFPVEQAEVRLDEGQYAWACTITLFDPVYYDLFQPGDIFSIDMLGEDYIFLYDGKSFSRNSIVDIAASVSGISPSAELGEPRAKKITKTWDTSVLALTAAQEVVAGYPMSWEILNWGLPAYRLAVEDMTPIEIVQLIATAAGGIVQTDPDGTLRVRYLFPIRVPDYLTAAHNQFYSDLDHNFTINEEVALPEIVNKIRIMDIAPGAFQDRVEFVQDEDAADRGYLKVFPSPWRDTLWVEHTSLPSVSAVYVGVRTEQLEPEDVEILDSKGSVSHPIYQLNTLEWLYLDLGGIVFESDKSEFTTTSTTHHESLLRITYTTRYLRFDVVAPGVEKVQFLVKEEEVV